MSKHISQAIFRPKAFPGESPGSILLRFSGAVFEKPTTALSAFGLNDGELCQLMRKFWRGDTTILSQIADLSDWQLEPYVLAKSNSRCHRDWMSTRHVSVCPDCAQEGHLPVTHDLKTVDTCAKHGLKLLTHCPHCTKPISWSRPSLTHCKCFKPLDSRIKASQNSLRFAKKVDELVQSRGEKAIDNLMLAKKVLSTRYQLSSDSAAEIALELHDGNTQSLSVFMGRFVQGHPSLNIRAVIAPISDLLSDFGISEDDFIARVAQKQPRLKAAYLPQSYYLTRTELMYALQTTTRVTSDLWTKNLHSQQVDGKGVELASLLTFYAHFVGDSAIQPQGNHRTLRELQAATKKPYSHFVSGIIDGNYKAVTAIQESGLPDVKIEFDLSTRDSIPTGYLTQRETEAYLHLYGVAVTSARQAGLLRAKAQPDRWNRYLYERSSVDHFMKNYVTCGQLAKQLSTSAKPLKRKLEYLGINPISGPDIDGTTLYIFATKSIKGLTKAQLAIAEREYRGVGRKGADAPRPDKRRWMTAKDVTSLLQVSNQKLKYLTRVTPLVEGVPETSSSKATRYFKRDSAEKAKAFIDSLVPIDELVRSTGLSRQKLLRRIRLLIRDAVITINKTNFVTPNDAQRFLSHSRDYWCADTAAEFLGCKRFDINNWRKMGVLDAIPPTDRNFVGTPHLYLRTEIEKFRRYQQHIPPR
ncbi:TniQ family protein [Litorivivens sp.]|uniref:TniQ family protein n=1 Tax=Litorivivens sp. TaxID=2020868 RepID=UPI003569CC47